MTARARDPAEIVLQGAALAITAGVAVFFAIAKFAPDLAPGAKGIVDQVQLSVIAPPRAEPAPPRPKQQPHIVHLPRPQHAVPIQHSDPQPVAQPKQEEATADAAPVAEPAPPPAPAGSGRPDPDLAYETQLRAIVNSRTCPPDTPEYRLLHPSGKSTVSFVLARNGHVLSASIAQSAGSSILDKQAYAIVSEAIFPPMPADVFAGESTHPFYVFIAFKPGASCAE